MINKTTFCFDVHENNNTVHGNVFYYCDGEYYIVLNNAGTREITINLIPNLTSVIVALNNFSICYDDFKMYLYCENADTCFKTIETLSTEKLNDIINKYANDDLYIYHRYPDIDSLIKDIKK